LKDLKDEIYRTSYGDVFEDVDDVPIDNDFESVIPSFETDSNGTTFETEPEINKAHDPEAWDYYDRGQKAFVDGEYDQAIRYYELALGVEPTWKTVQDALELAHKYQSGDIPERNLPPEVQRLYRTALNEYKKIESRTNAEDYSSALTILERAKKALTDALNIFREKTKLNSWEDAYNLESQLDDIEVQIDQAKSAQELFNEAKDLFGKNKIEDAIEKARLAYEIQKIPAYQGIVTQWEEFKLEVNRLNAELNTGDLTIESLSDLLQAVRTYEAQYPQHPALANIQSKVKENTPEFIKQLDNQMLSFLKKAKSARIIKKAEDNANKARKTLQQRRKIGADYKKQQELIDFENELVEIEEQISNYRSDIETASDLMHGGEDGWQDQVEKVARQAMRRFSQDPITISIRSDTNRIKRKKILRIISIVLAVLAIIAVCIGIAGGRYWYVSTRPTATPTLPPTRTPTITLTPPPTLTPSVTPTPKPPIAYLKQNAWAKNDCYDGNGNGWIQNGAKVQLLSNDYKESNNYGPCALVEYPGGEAPVTGWIPIRWLDFP